jgi:hypothetical protein
MEEGSGKREATTASPMPYALCLGLEEGSGKRKATAKTMQNAR